jgi:uncharacterized membrane protein
MGGLSYQERTLWGSLAAELVVYVPYFVWNLHRANSVAKVAGTIFAIIVLQIIVQSIIAAATRHRITDERDKLIQLRGYRAGYLTWVTLMVFGLGMLWAHSLAGRFPIHAGFVGLHFLNVFFGMLVISDVVKTVAQIVAYRRDS